MEKTAYVGLHELTKKHPMFSFEDKAIVRYEMVREWIATDQSANVVAKKYGYTRTRVHVNAKRIEEEGIAGVIDKKPGPKEPTKATPEVEQLVIQIRRRDKKAIDEIAKELKEKYGISLSPRSVDTILTKNKLPKKNRGRKPKRKTNR